MKTDASRKKFQTNHSGEKNRALVSSGFVGYVKKDDYLSNRVYRTEHTNISQLYSNSIDGTYDTNGEGFLLSKSQLETIRMSKPVYSGNRDLVPHIPFMVIPPHRVDLRSRYKLPVHIRSFLPNAYIVVSE